MVKKWSEYKAEQRAKRAQAGLKRYEIWLHPKDWPTVQKLLKKLSAAPPR